MRNDAMDFLRAGEQDAKNRQAEVAAGQDRRWQRKSGERAHGAIWAWAHQTESYDWMDRHDLLCVSEGCVSDDAGCRHVFPTQE